MVLNRKGGIGRYEMVAAAFGVIATAAILYVWSNALPGETIVVDTP